MGDILFRLIVFISTNKNNDVDYNIAINILKNLNVVGKLTINQLADKCYTSPSAISRFCRKLGYESFGEFKETLAATIRNYRQRDFIHDLRAEFGEEATLKEMLYNKIISDLDSINNMDEALINRIVDMIHDTETVGVFGTHLSQAYAQDLEINFLAKGKFINAFLDIQKQMELLDTFDKDCLAIIFSPSGKFIAGNRIIAEKIKASKCRIIFISQLDYRDFFDKVDVYLKLTGSTGMSVMNLSIRYASLYVLDYIFLKYTEKYIGSRKS